MSSPESSFTEGNFSLSFVIDTFENKVVLFKSPSFSLADVCPDDEMRVLGPGEEGMSSLPRASQRDITLFRLVAVHPVRLCEPRLVQPCESARFSTMELLLFFFL